MRICDFDMFYMFYSSKKTSEASSRMDRVPSFMDEGNDCKSPPTKEKRLSLSLKRKGRNDEQKNRFAKLSEFELLESVNFTTVA